MISTLLINNNPMFYKNRGRSRLCAEQSGRKDREDYDTSPGQMLVGLLRLRIGQITIYGNLSSDEMFTYAQMYVDYY